MKTHLTDITVKTLKPSDRQTDYFCMQTKNFGLRVSPGGTKTFFVLTGPAEARRRVRIGTYPNITLKAARKAAALTINQSITPGVPTYETALTAYLDVIRQNYRARSAYLTERHLTLHVKSLYPKQLTDLTAQDVYQLLKPLPPSEANHTFGALKTFLNWAAARYTVLNPLQNSHKPHKETSRDRTPTDAEVKAIWHACPDSQFGSIVKALILSGQRRSQIAALQASWMSDDVIAFPKEIMKSKAEHTFPLTPALKAVLRPDVYYNGWGKHKAALDTASGTSGWTLHDLRRYFSSTCAELGIPQHVTERILAHKVGGTETQISKVYNRYKYLKEMRSALEQYQNHVVKLVEQTQTGDAS